MHQSLVVSVENDALVLQQHGPCVDGGHYEKELQDSNILLFPRIWPNPMKPVSLKNCAVTDSSGRVGVQL